MVSTSSFAGVMTFLSLLPLSSRNFVLQKNEETRFDFDLPERSRHSIRPGNIGRLEKRGRPGPLTNDDTSRETGFDHASCSAVVSKNKEKTRVGVA